MVPSACLIPSFASFNALDNLPIPDFIVPHSIVQLPTLATCKNMEMEAMRVGQEGNPLLAPVFYPSNRY